VTGALHSCAAGGERAAEQASLTGVRPMSEDDVIARIVFATALSFAISLPAPGFGAQQSILCTAHGKADVVITLQEKKQFGRTLDCISGDFITDLTPCAPDGAFGLSAPTGAAPMVKIVNRWQDYMSHDGGVTSHFISADKIYFSGGFVFDGEYKDVWTFTLNRFRGTAELQRGADKNLIPYMCHPKKPLM
jgi:hypothetical protein